jgi:methyl halide transferase
MSIPKDVPLDQARAALKAHFNEYSGDNYADGWAKLWADGSFLPWDRGFPSPALTDTLENHRDLIGGPMLETRRKKALVPGCGRGVDVILLQSFGYDAVGLEVSAGAVQAAKEFADQYSLKYPARDGESGKGSCKFVHGDFYKNDFLADAGLNEGEKFDLIYDYTVSSIHQLQKRSLAI